MQIFWKLLFVCVSSVIYRTFPFPGLSFRTAVFESIVSRKSFIRIRKRVTGKSRSDAQRHTHIQSLARPRQGPVLLCESVTSIAVFDTALCQWERAYESPVSCLIRETGCFPYWVKLSAKGLVLHLENTPLLQIRPQTVQTHPGASAIQT